MRKSMKGLAGPSGWDFEDWKNAGGKRSSGRYLKNRHARRDRAAWKREIASIVSEMEPIETAEVLSGHWFVMVQIEDLTNEEFASMVRTHWGAHELESDGIIMTITDLIEYLV